MTNEQRAEDEWRTDISKRMKVMETQHVALKTAVEVNTAICGDVKKNTDDIVEFFTAGKGFFKVASYIGRIAKWLAAVAAACGAIYAAVHFGQK